MTTLAAIVAAYLFVALWTARRLAWEWNNDSNKCARETDQGRRIGAMVLSIFLLPIAGICLLGYKENDGFDSPPRRVRKELAEAKKKESLADTEQRVRQLQREIDALAKQ